MYQIGSIIFVEYQIFDLERDNSRTQIDHSKRRPALIIAEDEDCFYYLTLTSKARRGCFGYYTNEIIKSNSTVQCIKEKRIQYVQIGHIYSKKIYGAIELTRINDDDLYQILINVYEFHKTKGYNNFNKIEKSILKTIKNLAIKTNKKLDKR